MEYDLELDKAIEEIKKIKAKNVLVQFPDGLKPKATEVAEKLKKETTANIFIWMESCWGSCDYPEIKNIDLLIQFGHAPPDELRPIPG
ncbi:MAG: diphthamide synthesis protein [Nanoarchaeota archaeon]